MAGFGGEIGYQEKVFCGNHGSCGALVPVGDGSLRRDSGGWYRPVKGGPLGHYILFNTTSPEGHFDKRNILLSRQEAFFLVQGARNGRLDQAGKSIGCTAIQLDLDETIEMVTRPDGEQGGLVTYVSRNWNSPLAARHNFPVKPPLEFTQDETVRLVDGLAHEVQIPGARRLRQFPITEEQFQARVVGLDVRYRDALAAQAIQSAATADLLVAA